MRGGCYRILVGSETPLSLVPMRTLVPLISSEHVGKDLLPFPNPLTFPPSPLVVLGTQPKVWAIQVLDHWAIVLNLPPHFFFFKIQILAKLPTLALNLLCDPGGLKPQSLISASQVARITVTCCQSGFTVCCGCRCVCACLHVQCMWAYVYGSAGARTHWRPEEDIPGVFFYQSLPYVLKQDLLLGPKAYHFG